MRTLTDPIGLAKAILWEEAKGKLRALIAAEGAGQSTDHDKPLHTLGVREPFRFQVIEQRVDEFIAAFEGDGLHE